MRWRYRLVLNGFAVELPARESSLLARLPNVRHVDSSVRYHARLNESVPLIGAPQLWGPNLATAGNGIKIGIIDDGVDQRHQFFSPRGFSAPPGFPKGKTAYTTAKVIVARAFPPRSPHWKYAGLPFDPQLSEHGTHVAGIAAGDHDTQTPEGFRVSGVAPRAYIGNYKVLTIPTPEFGLDGNSPEIVAGIEAAVRDGMNVINLSLGEPEIEPSRDIVTRALDGAAAAGVVPVVAAGNDFDQFGFGSISSPGTASRAISAAAATKSRTPAAFSSAGPTPLSLRLKPDVSAPGVAIYSSVPTGWDTFSGTSMAAPHVAGGAALLLQRHPTWTVDDVKSALVSTARPVYTSTAQTREAPVTQEGGGLIYLPAANDPLIFTRPSTVSFGFVHRRSTRTVPIRLDDAGGGAGAWTVSLRLQHEGRGLALGVPRVVTVPGNLTLTATAARAAAQADTLGFVVLSRPGVERRIPFWLRVTAPALRREHHRLLRRTGTYRGNTRRGRALVSTYRYPSNATGAGVARSLRGREQVFRVRLRHAVANFGAAVVWHARGTHVSPRVVRAGDENRLVGYTALPLDQNPYRALFGDIVPIVGAIRPAAGSYDIVFDTPRRRAEGRFRFRFWIGDVTPPSIRLLTKSIRRGGRLLVRVSDRGSGVDRRTLAVTIDGGGRSTFSYRSSLLVLGTGGLGRGRHTLRVVAADRQEAKNMENTGPILPNTRTMRAAFRVR